MQIFTFSLLPYLSVSGRRDDCIGVAITALTINRTAVFKRSTGAEIMHYPRTMEGRMRTLLSGNSQTMHAIVIRASVCR